MKRLRFAPSPTGFLHLGGLRTALFNFLIARQHPESKFILRIEDTDRSRLVPGATEHLIRTLQWAGIVHDEGPGRAEAGFGPYIQSERLAIYKAFSKEIVDSGAAYPCFCPKERLQLLKGPSGVGRYDRLCRSIAPKEAASRIADGQEHVIRLKIDSSAGSVNFKDVVYGNFSIKPEQLDDAVLVKSDGFPTYHFANVVDDHLMRIDTVIRGQEWIASTPLHLLIYRAFNWTPPAFAHLPLLVNADGSKLSKRQNDAHVQSYIDGGFLPAALVNFVAFLGWTPPGTQKEVLSMAELIEAFTLERVNQSDATVNFEKLRWLNRQHLRLAATHDDAIISQLRSWLPQNGKGFNDDYLRAVLQCAAERCALLPEIPRLCAYFFEVPDYTSQETSSMLQKSKIPKELESMRVEDLLSKNPGLLRLVLSGCRVGPPVDAIFRVLGTEESEKRLESFKAFLKQSFCNK